MPPLEFQKQRVAILVKAYPQPSQKYQETVCCAGITPDLRLLRLYPIRYRHLRPEQQFDRFDVIEVELTKTTDDTRPESYKVKEETLRIVQRGSDMSPEQKVQLWLPYRISSNEELKKEQQETGRSLGIVRPDAGSVKLLWSAIGDAAED